MGEEKFMIKHKKIWICILVILILTAGTVITVKLINKNMKGSPIELTCIKIPEGETCDIVIVEPLYGGKTASHQANYMEHSEHYSGGYVDDKGRLVAVVNQEQARYWFDYYFNELIKNIEYSKETKVKMDVSSRCDILMYYVNSDVTLEDLYFAAPFLVIPDCLMVQEYAGVPYEEIDTKLQIIYEPKGEIMYELKLGEDYKITQSDWEARMKEMEQ